MTHPPMDVEAGFDAAATGYDRMAALNPGYHRHLRTAAQTLCAMMTPPAGRPARVADIGCGTGASTAALVSVCGPETVVDAVDASAGMLARAGAKVWPSTVAFHRARAQDLPPPEQPYDGVLAAFLMRNVPEHERDAVAVRLCRLARSGGAVVIVDYSLGSSARARLVWRVICTSIVIPLARWTKASPRMYRYLKASVEAFDSPERLAARLDAAGATDVAIDTVPGWQRGILHIVSARVPGHRDRR